MSITNFVLQVKGISDQLMVTGNPFSDKDVIVCIFGSVGSYFNPCVTSINMNFTYLTIEEVFSNFLSYKHILGKMQRVLSYM